MTTLTIYTTGSAELLEIMLNACAMITGSGSAEDLARVGALLGILLLAFQAAFNNQAITFQKAGLVLVLYMMFYGPTSTVLIQDTVSSNVRVVDNVPLGPAFVGSTISTVAYSIAKTSEQAFSSPGMTEYGLFSSLSTMSKVRDALRNPMALDGFQNYQKASGYDLPKTINEYMTFCSLSPVALREDKTLAELYRAPGWESVVTNTSTGQFIYVYDGTAGGSLKSCSDAKTFLTAHIKNAYTSVLNDILQKGFSEEVKSGRMNNGTQVEAALNQSIQSVALSGKSAQDYVLTSLIAPIFNTSRVDALNHWQEQRAAMALQESINQQEIAWAGKGDSFKHYMRPMIAFFEGLLYAMTPFMAFALLLGGPGLSVLGKYLVLPLAVGLWMPLLSFVNAFTLWYAEAELTAAFDAYGGATSAGFAMLQLQDIDRAIGKALGVGGLLAASVPPLALFIVSGSAMVANGIMGQMTAGDKFKSEDVLPRTQQSAPVLASNAAFTSDQVGAGVSKTGSLQLAETISGEQAASAVVQSASTASQTASAQYQESLKAAGQQLSSTSTGRQAMAQIGENLSASSALTSNSSYNQSKETLRSLGFSDSSLNQATANASLGVSTPLGGLKRTDNTSADSMTQEGRAKAEKALAQLTQSVQATDSNQLTYATGDAFSRSDLAQSSASNTDEIAKNRTNALQAQQTYNKASSEQDTIKAGQSLNLRDAGVNALTRGMGREESGLALERMAGETASGKELYKQAFNSQSVQDMSQDMSERRAMAAIRTMNQDGRLGDLLMSQYNPFDFNVNQGDANANAKLEGDAASATAGVSNLAGQFNSKWGSNSGSYASTNDMNQSGYDATKESGPAAIEQRNAANLNPVMEDSSAHNAQIDTAASKASYDEIRDRGAAARQGTNLGTEVAVGANSIFAGINTIEAALRGGDDSARAGRYYDIGMKEGLQPEEAKYFAAKATGEFGEAQGAAYQELAGFYRSQGISDESYIAGAITTIDDAAKAPDSGSFATLGALADSKSQVQYASRPTRSSEDVPQVPDMKPQRPTGINAD
ncbi:conjugal transfer protein TraG N-terminal domain-containing protein [Pseudomonas sp. 2FE]|uniref:conjugal transfer protein TraG N-terminal domain-containing protein n=1 Tax=Pseudomonas sp. 2FE TaxID=2502190 RepID=UPI0010F7ACF0|nr:conjugal transfer protein TraG N-terminal domain-containing protein [Pseudomonas sp. 2FE]